MTRVAFSSAVAFALSLGLGSTVMAYDWLTPGAAPNNVYPSTIQLPLIAISDCGCETSCGKVCDTCDDCCSGGAMVFDVEFTFLKYGQEGGVMDVNGAPGSFGWGLAPRFEVGYVRDDGVGIRGRFWFYDHSTTSLIGNAITVNAQVYDLEVFRNLELCCGTNLQISGGLRYLNFNHFAAGFFFDDEVGEFDAFTASHFDGFGLTTAANYRWQVGVGSVYTKTRWSLLMGDIEEEDEEGFGDGQDHPVNQIEIGVGYEVVRYLDNGAIFRLCAGGEFQQWLSIVPMSFLPGSFGDDDQIADASFAGIVIGGGLDY